MRQQWGMVQRQYLSRRTDEDPFLPLELPYRPHRMATREPPESFYRFLPPNVLHHVQFCQRTSGLHHWTARTELPAPGSPSLPDIRGCEPCRCCSHAQRGN